jgi:taurine dioxygenase
MKTAEIAVRALSPFGAEIGGIDLRDDWSEATAQRLRGAFDTHALLVFHDQELAKGRLREVAAIFGPITDQGEAPGGFNIVSNLLQKGANEAGEYSLGNGDGPLKFHFDHCFEEMPLKGIMLYGAEVPPPGSGGDTLFADMRAATQLLPKPLLQRVAKLNIHHRARNRTGDPEHTHPLLWRHPITGAPILFFSRNHAKRIVELSGEESAAMMEEFPAYIERPEVNYRHAWQPKDLVVWDNLALQHARTDFDPSYRRHMLRYQIGF